MNGDETKRITDAERTAVYTLVAISLFLTVRILSTPSTIGLGQNSTTSVSANLTNTKKIEDVFAPIRMIVHTDKRIYLTQNAGNHAKA